MSHCFRFINLNCKPHILLDFDTRHQGLGLLQARMAATASLTDVSSLTAVLSLYHTIRSRAPANSVARPVTSPKSDVDVPRYFDEAIDLLSTATNDAYVDRDSTDRRINNIRGDLVAFQSKVDQEFQYVHKRFDQVNGRFEKVDGRLDKVDRRPR